VQVTTFAVVAASVEQVPANIFALPDYCFV